jgi:hypothetical protein
MMHPNDVIMALVGAIVILLMYLDLFFGAAWACPNCGKRCRGTVSAVFLQVLRHKAAGCFNRDPQP